MENKNISAELDQYRIMYDEPIEIKVGKKKIKLKPMLQGSLDLISKYYTQQQEATQEDGTAGLIVKLNPNVKLQCKALSVAILNSKWKIRLLHRFYWNKLYWSLTAGEVLDLTTLVMNKLGLAFFLNTSVLTKGLNSLKKKETTHQKSSQAEPELEK